jgi:hypothetical protein
MVFDGDPTEDIRAVRPVRLVVRESRIVHRLLSSRNVRDTGPGRAVRSDRD